MENNQHDENKGNGQPADSPGEIMQKLAFFAVAIIVLVILKYTVGF